MTGKPILQNGETRAAGGTARGFKSNNHLSPCSNTGNGFHSLIPGVRTGLYVSVILLLHNPHSWSINNVRDLNTDTIHAVTQRLRCEASRPRVFAQTTLPVAWRERFSFEIVESHFKTNTGPILLAGIHNRYLVNVLIKVVNFGPGYPAGWCGL